jgi:uncharacterized membrane protein YgcG
MDPSELIGAMVIRFVLGLAAFYVAAVLLGFFIVSRLKRLFGFRDGWGDRRRIIWSDDAWDSSDSDSSSSSGGGFAGGGGDFGGHGASGEW